MKALVCLGVVSLALTPVAAAQKASAVVATAEASTTQVAKVTIGPKECVIRGNVIDTANVPLPAKSVRLRNLDTSKIEQITVTDRDGLFSFIASAEMPYVVEVVDEPGRVAGVGRVLLARAGEVAGDTVIVPAALPASSSGFKTAAGAVLSALGGTGLTALAPQTPPLSPEK